MKLYWLAAYTILFGLVDLNVNYAKEGFDRKNGVSKPRCSRMHSKFIREYFARELLPIYHKFRLPVPEKCTFSPLHDIYHFQENNKTKEDIYRWKCEMCGKIFTSEAYLDKHFENRHTSTLQNNKHSVCLANYCRIFRCEILMKSAITKEKCYESTMTNLRKRCIAQLDLCIPKGISMMIRNQLTAELRESLCSYLTCDKYYDLPKYLHSGPSFLKIFLIIFFVGFCIVTYGVINHTDLIFDENEAVEPSSEPDINLNTQSTNRSILKDSTKRTGQSNKENTVKPNPVRHRVNFDLDKKAQ